MRDRIATSALVLLLLPIPACGGGSAYEVTVISRDASGRVSESSSRGRAKGTNSAVPLMVGTENATVVCKASGPTGGTFLITWPDRSKEEVTVPAGGSSDHFYLGGDVGLRIAVDTKP